MPGPPPSPNPVRRNARTGPLLLPAQGRTDPPPHWPLEGQTASELDVWADLWASPQAVAWEKMGWTRVVARFCRLLVAAERPDATVALLAEVRQLEDRLGLTPMSMRRLLWQVATDEVGEKRDRKAPDTVRGRLRAVEGA